MKKPIPVQLDHINGQHSDNRLKNLRVLLAHSTERDALDTKLWVFDRARAETLGEIIGAIEAATEEGLLAAGNVAWDRIAAHYAG